MIESFSGLTDDLLAALADLLIDGVADGASVGFLAPLSTAAARQYWAGVAAELTAGQRILLIARLEGRIVGTVQVVLAGQPNAAHRAEVQKLLVHTSARRQGLGAALMAAAEQAALAAGRHLLVLDTRAGDTASRLYERHGYRLAGCIPKFARSSSGSLDATAIYYRDLADRSGHRGPVNEADGHLSKE